MFYRTLYSSRCIGNAVVRTSSYCVFMNFCNPSPPHSMACESIDREELLKMIDNLNNNHLDLILLVEL